MSNGRFSFQYRIQIYLIFGLLDRIPPKSIWGWGRREVDYHPPNSAVSESEAEILDNGSESKTASSSRVFSFVSLTNFRRFRRFLKKIDFYF